jgi:protease-4
MNFALASALLRGQWLIDPLYAQQALPMVQNVLDGKLVIESDPVPVKMVAIIGGAGSGRSVARNIAITHIKGVMMKDDQQCGPSGMATIGATLRALDNDPSVVAHVIVGDSPGGTVDGTEVLGNTVAGLKKPKIGLVDGLCASANLWVMSNCDELMATTELDEIGSVGVLLSFYDIDPYWEKRGVRKHTIVSNLSPDKVKMWEDLRAGKYDEYKKIFLDPIATRFQEVIRQNFPKVKEEHLTGRMFYAKDLLGIMIDKIGSLDDAIIRAAELAEQNPKPISANNKPKSSMKKYSKIMSVLSITELATDEGFSSLSEEQLDAIEAALPEASQDDLQLQVQQANDVISQRDSRITELEAEVAQLRNEPAEEAATVIPQVKTGATDTSMLVDENTPLAEAIEIVKQEYGI